MDKDLKREIILDNYQNPFNKNLINDDNYIKVNSNNESCIDDINIMVLIENDTIKDIRFDGEACAISTSSTSIMLKKIIYKKLNKVEDIITNYEKMINEEEYDDYLLDDLLVYDEIYKQPNRKNCALLSTKAIKEAIYIYRNNKK